MVEARSYAREKLFNRAHVIKNDFANGKSAFLRPWKVQNPRIRDWKFVLRMVEARSYTRENFNNRSRAERKSFLQIV